MGRITNDIFCAFCKLGRKVYIKKHVNWTNVVLCILLSILFMFGLWQNLDGRVMILFAVFTISAEVFVYFRWRMSLSCPHCGFDPILYKTDRARAVAKVKTRLEDLRASGKHLLKQNNPFLNLPVLTKDKAPAAKKSSSFSKQI